jgi:hypothetical protein
MPAMAVIYCEKLRFNAIFLNIQSNTDSIFIVISTNAWVGIDSICFDYSILFWWGFSWLKVIRKGILLILSLFSSINDTS